jgi:AcrR family transcriptional regulator
MPRLRPSTQRKRVEILRAAAAVFRRRGYHGASIGHISRALKMAKGHLYYYFRNKEEILYVCHDYSLDLILKELKVVERSSLPPDRQIHRLIVSFVHLFIDVLHGTAWTLEVEAHSSGGDAVGRVRGPRSEARGVCDLRRDQLDSPLVRSCRPGDVARNRAGVCWLPGRRPAECGPHGARGGRLPTVAPPRGLTPRRWQGMPSGACWRRAGGERRHV